jgi:mycothiol synthase
MDDVVVDVIADPGSGTAEVVDLVDGVTAAIGHAALSEHKRDELDGWSGVSGGAASTELGDEAVGVVARSGDRRRGLLGYAHLSVDSRRSQFAVELVVPGSTGELAAPVADRLLDAVEEQVAQRGGGLLRLWVALAGGSDDARAGDHGFAPERDLLQMRCPLPLPPDDAHDVPLVADGSVRLRSFRPGLDEDAWVVTNNRAFATHPEQGQWTKDMLVDREREPWFDPDGFLVLEAGGRLAGSCWTKVHDATVPRLGEIYVISVDPDFHGRGWGRALTRAGLDWLSGRGITVGMLYVDGANVAAVSLYGSMGFSVDHVDRAYVKHVAATGPRTAAEHATAE